MRPDCPRKNLIACCFGTDFLWLAREVVVKKRIFLCVPLWSSCLVKLLRETLTTEAQRLPREPQRHFSDRLPSGRRASLQFVSRCLAKFFRLLSRLVESLSRRALSTSFHRCRRPAILRWLDLSPPCMVSEYLLRQD